MSRITICMHITINIQLAFDKLFYLDRLDFFYHIYTHYFFSFDTILEFADPFSISCSLSYVKIKYYAEFATYHQNRHQWASSFSIYSDERRFRPDFSTSRLTLWSPWELMVERVSVHSPFARRWNAAGDFQWASSRCQCSARATISES